MATKSSSDTPRAIQKLFISVTTIAFLLQAGNGVIAAMHMDLTAIDYSFYSFLIEQFCLPVLFLLVAWWAVSKGTSKLARLFTAYVAAVAGVIVQMVVMETLILFSGLINSSYTNYSLYEMLGTAGVVVAYVLTLYGLRRMKRL